MAFFECEIHGRRRLLYDLAASSWFKKESGLTLFAACMRKGDGAPPAFVADHDLLCMVFAAGARRDMPKITTAKAMEIIQAHLDGGGSIEDVWRAVTDALTDSRIYGGGKDQEPEAKAPEQ